MKADIRMRWVERLRSGDYKQRTGGLYRKTPDGSESYCCLGVLCTIAEEDGIISRDRWKNESLLPSEVQAWAGIPNADPIVDSASGTQATNANDNGAKFTDIATAISRSL